MAGRIFIPQLGIEAVPPAVEAQNLNHQTTRAVPSDDIYLAHQSLHHAGFRRGAHLRSASHFPPGWLRWSLESSGVPLAHLPVVHAAGEPQVGWEQGAHTWFFQAAYGDWAPSLSVPGGPGGRSITSRVWASAGTQRDSHHSHRSGQMQEEGGDQLPSIQRAGAAVGCSHPGQCNLDQPSCCGCLCTCK